ncbi:restriction endonuclease subunit S [Bifidobacterium longum]|uniref:restriction endonuclease subunit S n=2 Tax=Bifidobacterium longum TaxID=216816 RepID=UPI000214C174|nr:restriction endonuclease S subunit [Bifidobacterium longum subsp. longum KACC 91563]
MTEQAKVPAIRFAGFTDPWEQRKFGDCFEFLKSNTLSRAGLNGENGTARNVHYGDILIKFGDCLDGERSDLPFITDDTVLPKYAGSILREGDVIFADTAEDETAGKCVELRKLPKEPTISGLHTIPARPRFPFGTGYLGHYLNSDAYHRQLLPLMQGIKVISVSKAALQDTQVRFPGLSEQSAIGAALNEIDSLITLHQRKYDKLVIFKKSMLEKMFPKDGESVPEIRFAGFTDPWEQRELVDIAEIVGGGTPDTNNSNYWDGDIDWYAPAELGNNIYAESSTRKITQAGFDSCSTKMLPADKTILFTSRAGIGNTAILRHSACTNQGFQSLVIGDADVYFVYSMSERIKKWAEEKASGSTFLEISGRQLETMPVNLPSLVEQQAIGSFFSHLDDLITLHQRKLELLQNIKKSLLDKMFA